MQTTVGSYRVIFADNRKVYIVPLGKRCKLKEPILYDREQVPKYVRDYVEFRLRYMGYIYLIHAESKIGNPNKPTGQAQHYMGFAKDVDLRLLRHIGGRGAAIMRAFSQANIPTRVVRVWIGDRYFERKLKNGHNRVRLCPICKEGG